MYDYWTDPFAAMLHVRFAEANARFSSYAPRRRLAAQYFSAIDRLGLCQSGRLPPDYKAFLTANYSPRVPFHGLCHPLIMLVTNGMEPLRSQSAFELPVVLASHDAAHNGIARESPEVLSAALNRSWLLKHPKWHGRLREVDGAIVASAFPHSAEIVSPLGRWMRWYDTFRNASGASALALNHAFRLGNDMTRFRCLLLESVGLYDEARAGEPGMYKDFHDWVEHAMADWFFDRVSRDVQYGTYYPLFRMETADVEALTSNRVGLRTLLASPPGRDALASVYDFCHRDFSIEEFVAHCDDLHL